MCAVGLVIFGLGAIIYNVLMIGLNTRRQRQLGEPPVVTWSFLLQSPLVWFGIILIVAGINAVAAGILLLALLLIGLVQIGRGVRRLPKVWRDIGNPAAWRGHRSE
jgi:hypothetical protein